MVNVPTVIPLVLALLLSQAARAFECPPVKPSESRRPAYGPVAGQAICAGFFEKSVSQPFVELVSLTRGPGLQGDAVPAALQLQAASRMPLHLLVQPMRSTPLYRVDADLLPGQGLQWDPRPMLADTGLRPADIGFVARAAARGPAGTTAVAPVALTAAAGDSDKAVATVRASVEITSLAWRSYRLGAAAKSPPQWTEVPESQRYAFQRIEIPVELPADGKAIGVDIEARDAKKNPLPMLRLTIVGREDAAFTE
jgi:hypothetical protein